MFPCCKAHNVPYHKKVTGSSSLLHIWREYFLVYMNNLKVVIQIMYVKNITNDGQLFISFDR